jgi:hypothetical protein
MFKLGTSARFVLTSGALLGALTLTLAAHASPTTYTGIFQVDNEVVSSPTLPLLTIGSAGGTLSAHTFSWAQGGFVPLLMLFDSAGLLVGNPAIAGGLNNDVGFDLPLSMGTYTLALAQDGNLPNSPFLSDGFIYTNGPSVDANYSLLNANPGSDPGYFFSFFDGKSRNGNWSLNVEVTNNPDTTVPEPASLALVAAALGASLAARRRSAA